MKSTFVIFQSFSN